MGTGVFFNLDSVWREFLSVLGSCVNWWTNNGIIIYNHRYNYFEIGIAIMWCLVMLELFFPWFSYDDDGYSDKESDANMDFWGVD